MTQEDAASAAEASLTGAQHLDAAEMVVYERLRHLGCTVCADPSDPEDCASVAEAAVAALRQAGLLTGGPVVTQEDVARAAEASLAGCPNFRCRHSVLMHDVRDDATGYHCVAIDRVADNRLQRYIEARCPCGNEPASAPSR